MFEALTLGVFEVGLSWSTVFQKRDAFRKAFRDFDPARIATMTERDVDRLLQDASIIRNRAKIRPNRVQVVAQFHGRHGDASATQADSRRCAFEVAICDLRLLSAPPNWRWPLASGSPDAAT